MTRMLLILILACAGCSPDTHPAAFAHRSDVSWMTTTIAPQEGILGRVAMGNTLRLLTNNHRIVSLDLPARHEQSADLRGVADTERLTGFAALPDGSLWTLSGWTTLLRLNTDGRVVERRPLRERQTGLHSGFEQLLYQPLDFTAGSAALVAGPPGEGGRETWGTLRVRGGDEGGAIRLALSLASCGIASGGRMPCWLTNDAAVEIVDHSGQGTTVVIPALAGWVANDLAAFATSPHRVIRDVWLGSADVMWLLARPEAVDSADRRGERGLWKVDGSGRVLGRRVLAAPARLILGADRGRVFLLTADGGVVAVEV